MPNVDFVDDFNRPDGPVGNGWTDLASVQDLWNEPGEVPAMGMRGRLVTRPGVTMIGEPPTDTHPYGTTADGVHAEGPDPTPEGVQRNIRVRPRILSESRIVNGRATFQAATTNLFWDYHNGEYGAHFEVGHFMLTRSLGVTDDVEVGLTWLCPERFSAITQVSPMGFVDPMAADPLAMGLLPIWDVSLVSRYIQNAFRCPENQVSSPRFYEILGHDGVMRGVWSGDPPDGNLDIARTDPGFSFGPNASHSIVLRATANKIAMYVDGARIIGPFDVPTQFRGRDGWGIHVIAIQPNPTLGLTEHDFADVFPATPLDHDLPTLVDSWYAASYTGNFPAQL